ncbi:T9SS C-terminal target domain-containing protein [Flavobacterium sp.]|uniref:T9SS C-terminal target domain-containing protein n=1 Tax=Flavobacterium sp. TaxID=239 RepID=UPI0026347842|nr:T9SS C-terminal target domain-containing protein [Flavobacterium sp.]
MNRKIIFLFLFYSLFDYAQISGCTDVYAKNYNPNATQNDGSCIYKKEKIKLTPSFSLDKKLVETSGLIHWNNRLWTHNDDTDTNLYALDTINGSILETYPLPNVINKDWEEIAQDKDFIYIGDFGNNAAGRRTDLNILRIEKNSLLVNNPVIEYIKFKYEDQEDFEFHFSNSTNFDCEAFVITHDSICLFTKEWKNKQTTMYLLPKVPGDYIARRKQTYNIKGLVTGATYFESKKIVALCGYTKTGRPFINLFYDFQQDNFFSGNKRKIKLKPRFYQIEGISTQDGLHYYITNEHLNYILINHPQEMHVLDFSRYLKSYLKQK